MINWFRKKKKTKVSIQGVHPQTDNEFKFYEFVAKENPFLLKEWYKVAKRIGLEFKPEYEKAVKVKIKTGEFRNPINFKEYFGLNFDFIAIDFETANAKRISACALGIVFVKNEFIVHEELHYIKPPKDQMFNDRHIGIHGITPNMVANSESFEHYWKAGLNEYFNNNLIVFHNASMDLSILRQLFEHHQIEDYDINYLDTMNLASHNNLPGKIVELANHYGLEIIDHHNPVEDAKLCANVFINLVEEPFDHNKLIYQLKHAVEIEEMEKYYEIRKPDDETCEDLKLVIDRYLLSKSEIVDFSILDSAFLFTGLMRIPRHEAQEHILKLGGAIKTGVSSKVNYVVLGDGFGWSKIEKVAKLNSEKGLSIKFLTEDNFVQIINNALK